MFPPGIFGPGGRVRRPARRRPAGKSLSRRPSSPGIPGSPSPRGNSDRPWRSGRRPPGPPPSALQDDLADLARLTSVSASVSSLRWMPLTMRSTRSSSIGRLRSATRMDRESFSRSNGARWPFFFTTVISRSWTRSKVVQRRRRTGKTGAGGWRHGPRSALSASPGYHRARRRDKRMLSSIWCCRPSAFFPARRRGQPLPARRETLAERRGPAPSRSPPPPNRRRRRRPLPARAGPSRSARRPRGTPAPKPRVVPAGVPSGRQRSPSASPGRTECRSCCRSAGPGPARPPVPCRLTSSAADRPASDACRCRR